MNTVKKLWFTDDRIFIQTDNGTVCSQPLRFFPRLCQASDEQRAQWVASPFGLHWPVIDEDISFESFAWDDDDPATLCYQGVKSEYSNAQDKGLG